MTTLSLDFHLRKKSVLFDGRQYHRFSVPELWQYLRELDLTGPDPTVLVVNVPLTGYVGEFEALPLFRPGRMRATEYFFRNKGFGFSTSQVPGVRVSPYAALPYWSVVQYLFNLNLSRGQYAPRYVPVFGADGIETGRLNLVETHSDLALWLLTDPDSDWSLTDQRNQFNELRDDFCATPGCPLPAAERKLLARSADLEEFRSTLGYALAHRWRADDPAYRVVGNRYTGGLLLPADRSLLEAYSFFCEVAYGRRFAQAAPPLGKRADKIAQCRTHEPRPDGRRRPSELPDGLTITRHAYRRARERLGWSKQALDNMTPKVWKHGLPPDQAPGETRRWMLTKLSRSESGNRALLHGQFLFIFGEKQLITVYNPDSSLY